MSGGSYEYICFADAEDLMSKTREIQEMSDRLAGLGYAPDAAKETQELLLTVRQYSNRINAMRERLQSVWRAVEWWDSCDSGEDELKKALDDYRGV
jgi:uncharacterized protein YPO0396